MHFANEETPWLLLPYQKQSIRLRTKAKEAIAFVLAPGQYLGALEMFNIIYNVLTEVPGSG